MTTDLLSEYLSRPCDEPGCDAVAVNNGIGRNTGNPGKWCNPHTDFTQPSHARDD